MNSLNKAAEISYMFYGGHHNLERARLLKQMFTDSKILSNQLEELSSNLTEKIKIEGDVTKEIIKAYKQGKILASDTKFLLHRHTLHGHAVKTHFGIFSALLQAFGEPAQKNVFEPLIKKLDIMGSVLLDEIHLNSGKEFFNPYREEVTTTATYDMKAHKFIINSPPGVYKRSKHFSVLSTHAIIFAKLQIAGKAYGVHPFIVELRNMKTGEIHRDIELKYLGQNIQTTAEGVSFMVAFKNTVISSAAMLTKFFSFNTAGELKDVKDVSLTEGAYLFEKVMVDVAMAETFQNNIDLAKGVNIALIYGNMRTQFANLTNSDGERKILEYQHNTRRSIPIFVDTVIRQVALIQLETNLRNLFLRKDLKKEIIHDVSVMLNCLSHHFAKTSFSSLELLREMMGGIGFLHVSGMPKLQENTAARMTSGDAAPEQSLIEFASILLKENLAKADQRSFFMKFFFRGIADDEAIVSRRIKTKDDLNDIYTIFGSYAGICLWYHRNLKTLLQDKVSVAEITAAVEKSPLLIKTLSAMVATFLDFMMAGTALQVSPVRFVNHEMQLFYHHLKVYIQLRLLGDFQYWTEKSSKVTEIVEMIEDAVNEEIKGLNQSALEYMDSFEFGPNELFSIINGNPDKYYAGFLDAIKNRNLRNEPRLVKDVQGALIECLKGGPVPKL